VNRKYLLLIVLVLFFLAHDKLGSCSTELVITGPVNIRSGRSLTYQNKTIYYDSSESPVFSVSGSLTLVDCQVIPLRDPVDFIHTTGGSVYLENVSVINPVFNNTARLIDADASDITLIDSSFKGFARADIWFDDDILISGCQFNVTEKIYFVTTNNLTVRDSNFDLVTNRSTTFFEVRDSERCRLFNNSFTLPASTAQRLGAWLVAVEFRAAHNIQFAENTVKNAGKVFVAYGCSNVVVRNNILANDEYVNSELQIANGCKDVLIANNTVWNLHDSFEVYDHENITIIGNHITTDVLGFYIKPSNRTAPTTVYILNNTQIGGSVSAQYTHGLVIDGNKFIDTQPIHLKNSTDAFVTNNWLINSSIENWDTFNTTIDGNTVLIGPGFRWLGNDNSTTIMGTNTVHIVEHNSPEITNVQINPSNPLDDETIEIRADVMDETGVQYVRFHYKINEGPWDVSDMTPVSGDTYGITVGPYGNNTDIEFYVSAKDTSYDGNTRVEDNNGNFYRVQILVEPVPVPTPTPPEPTPDPAPEPRVRIPGFPMGPIIIGLAAVITIIWVRLRRQTLTGKNDYPSTVSKNAF